MLSRKIAALLLTFGTANARVLQECSSPSYLTCRPATNNDEPTIDGDLADWVNVQGGIEAPLYGAMFGPSGKEYEYGKSKIKCLYTDSQIYFAIEVPGRYRFDATNNHLCAAVSTMFKLGEDATYINMGGCPGATSDCDSVPEECNSYRVDLGGHWELKDTKQAVKYDVNGGSGNDPIANKDDEYGVSAYCKLDDDGENAGNEWQGAWSFRNGTATSNDAQVGSYIFEFGRTLTTASSYTDHQFAAGEVYKFGIAFWDPFETNDKGWSDHGHYVTGCAKEWTDIWLAKEGEDSPPLENQLNDGVDQESIPSSTSSASTLHGNIHRVQLGVLFLMLSLTSVFAAI